MGIRTRTSGIVTFIAPATVAVVLEPEIDAWVQSVIASGRTVSANQQTLLNNLCVSGKANGWWTLMDRLWIFAVEAGCEDYGALLDIATVQFGTAVSSPVWTANLGFTGDGLADYIDTNFDPTVGANFTRNSACFFGWQTNIAADFGAFMGAPSDNNRLYTKYGGDNNTYGRVNQVADAGAVSGGTGRGLAHMNRSASNVVDQYRDGISIFTAANASVALTSENFTLLQSAGVFCSSTMAAAGFGGSLNATQAGALYTNLRTYMTAVGVP